MPSRRAFLAAIGAGTSVGAAGCNAFADDAGRDDYPEGVRSHSDWTTARADGANTAAVPGATGPHEGTVEWTSDFAVGPGVRSLVADGRLFVVDDVLRALDVEGGDVRWRARCPGPAPSVFGGAVYAPAPDGAALVQYDAATGAVDRRVPLPGRPATPPAVSNDFETFFLAVEGGRMVALRAEDGTVEWVRDVPGEVRVPIAVNLGAVVAATTTGEVHCLAPNGERRWWRNVHARMAGPPVLGDSRVYIGGVQRPVRALDRANGALAWTADEHVTPFDAAMAFDGRRLYTGSGRVEAIDAATGAVDWTWVPDGGAVDCSPAVVDGTVVVAGETRAGPDGEVGIVAGLDPAGGGPLSGPEKWRVAAGNYAGYAVAAGAGRAFVRVSGEEEEPRLAAVR